MTTSAPLRLAAEDKLDALRKLDPHSRWESLDDHRYCMRCDRVITGRQIEVAGGTRAHGPLRLECPTPDCKGTPQDWKTPGQRKASAGETTGSDGSGTHNAGYLHIRAECEGICITHNGHAAIVRRTRSGAVLPLSEIAQLNQPRASRGGAVSWLMRRAASVATDCRSLLGLLRPSARGHLDPVQ